MSTIDLRKCNPGDILISRQGHRLEYISVNPEALYPHSVKYLKSETGYFHKEGEYGTRTDDGFVFHDARDPETDNDIVEIIPTDVSALGKLRAELEPYKGTLVLNDFEVVCLVDVIDGEDDYYWVYGTFKGIVHSTCVAGWIPLKGKIPEKEYDRLLYMWNLNNVDKAI